VLTRRGSIVFMFEKRVYFVFLIFVCFLSLLVFKLYSLQIKNGDYYHALALGQQVSIEKEKGERGEIFFGDRKTPLATNIEKFVLYVYPSKVDKKRELSQVLSGVLNTSPESILEKLQGGKTFREEVGEKAISKIKKENFKGVSWQKFEKRIYPQKSLAGRVIGFVNEAGKGQYGIEGYYNKILEGKEGFIRKDKAPFGYLVSFSGGGFEPPKNGEGLILTLDFNIQYFSQNLLEEAFKEWKIDSGQIIVENPLTGEILALAEFPSFDPNKYQEVSTLREFISDSVQKLFEPGSVLKALTMAAALQEKEVTPDTTYEDVGFVKLGGKPIYNYHRKVWGEETMTEVLEKSINTGAVFCEQKLGKDRFLKYLSKFGCFKPTGIDLQGETYSANKNLRRGNERDVAVASFGQGIDITPIQLVQAYSIIANGGRLIKPHLVKAIIGPDEQIKKVEPEIGPQIISQDTSSKLTSMLVDVVEKGFGKRGRVKGYFIAGKTGTAQIPLLNGRGYDPERTIQSFIGYGPAINPKFLILIKLDNPKGVGTSEYSAAPLFRKLAKYIIDLEDLPPDYSEYEQ